MSQAGLPLSRGEHIPLSRGEHIPLSRGEHIPLSRGEHVAEKIRLRILEQELKPGASIGTEENLAAEFGMSRSAIRDALGRLRGLGLVELRQRKGVFVAQPDPAETLALLMPQYVVDHASFSELAQLRYSLEIGSVEAAVEHATDAHIQRLKALAHEFMIVLPHDLPKADQIDIEFHTTMLSATGSTLLRDMHHVIVGFFRRFAAEFSEAYDKEPSYYPEHVQIAQAFADRDAEKACTLLKTHLRRYFTLPKKMM